MTGHMTSYGGSVSSSVNCKQSRSQPSPGPLKPLDFMGIIEHGDREYPDTECSAEDHD